MDWLHPAYLWALAAVPVAVGLALYAAWRRRQALAALGEREVVDRLTRSVSVRRRRYKSTVVIIAIGLLALALAGPRIGSKMVDLQREGVDLVIALDVSESMLAQDVLPSRLAKAKFEIGKLVDDLNGDRVGLVLFAGDAFAQCPLTLDYSALRLFLDIADPSLIPTPGTNFNAAINEAVRMFETEGREAASIGRGRALLIVSDGENHVDVSNSLGALDNAGVAVFAAGVGETEGAQIPVYQDGRQVGYKQDDRGQTVLSALEEERLVELSRSGGYFRITRTSSSLDDFSDALNRLDQRAFDQQIFEEYEERYQWPLALGLLLLLLERLFSDRRRAKAAAATT